MLLLVMSWGTRIVDEEAGLLDTNIFIHAHTTDVHAQECQRFLAALESGRLRARLEPLVLHELSYALPRYIKQMTRPEVAEYLLTVLS
jgi:predicted nucleic acid-binding protein